MSEQDVETLRGAYESFNSGNIDAVVAILDENVEWNEPGGGKAPSGTFNGPQAVAGEVFAAIPQHFDELICTPDNFDDRGDTVVVTGRFAGKNKNGTELAASFEHTWVMKDGKVARLDHKVDEGWAAGWS